MMMIMAFFMAMLTLFRSLTGHVTKKLPVASPSNELNIPDVTLDTVPPESRPPSPPPAFAEADPMSNVVKRLVELEEKVETLQSKPSEMPYEKEELLNAAVCRVDALEAELIATKKVKSLSNVQICLLFENLVCVISFAPRYDLSMSLCIIYLRVEFLMFSVNCCKLIAIQC